MFELLKNVDCFWLCSVSFPLFIAHFHEQFKMFNVLVFSLFLLCVHWKQKSVFSSICRVHHQCEVTLCIVMEATLLPSYSWAGPYSALQSRLSCLTGWWSALRAVSMATGTSTVSSMWCTCVELMILWTLLIVGTWRCINAGDWRRVATGSLALYRHGSVHDLPEVVDPWDLHGSVALYHDGNICVLSMNWTCGFSMVFSASESQAPVMHHHGHVYCFIFELHLQNLNSLLDLLDGRHLSQRDRWTSSERCGELVPCCKSGMSIVPWMNCVCASTPPSALFWEMGAFTTETSTALSVKAASTLSSGPPATWDPVCVSLLERPPALSVLCLRHRHCFQPAIMGSCLGATIGTSTTSWVNCVLPLSCTSTLCFTWTAELVSMWNCVQPMAPLLRNFCIVVFLHVYGCGPLWSVVVQLVLSHPQPPPKSTRTPTGVS